MPLRRPPALSTAVSLLDPLAAGAALPDVGRRLRRALRWPVPYWPPGAHAFGSGPSFRLGVEEEHLLVSPAPDHALDPAIRDVLADLADLGAVPGAVEADTFAACVELVTPILGGADEAGHALGRLRGAVLGAGGTPMGVGLHPVSAWGDAVHADGSRYQRLAADLRGLLGRTPTCALHVHVGLPDPETAVRVTNRMRAHLPLLVALSANSPFWHGADSGLASTRWATWSAYPRTGVPPTFADYAHYEQLVTELCAAGGLDDFSYLWWDVRPNPRLGTVEVRIMDAQSSLEATTGLAALVHGLVLTEAESPPWSAASSVGPEAVAESCFRAARDGLDADLWDGDGWRPAREIAARVLSRIRGGGRDDALEALDRLLREGGGAGRQREVFARRGSRGLLAHLVADTARGAERVSHTNGAHAGAGPPTANAAVGASGLASGRRLP